MKHRNLFATIRLFLCATVAISFSTGCSKVGSGGNASSEPAISVSQLQQDILKYNGKQVKVKGTIVDTGSCYVGQMVKQFETMAPNSETAVIGLAERMGQNRPNETSLYIADKLPEFTGNFHASSGPEGAILFTPAPSSVHPLDDVEIEGTFDGENKVIHITSAKIIGHETVK